MPANIVILTFCQALMMSGSALIMVTSALVGLVLAPGPQWATLPLACVFFGMLVITFPASLLMKRIGRQAGFIFGLTVGVGGSLLATYAILERSFGLFCTALLLIGVINGFGQYYRFAAADVANEAYRGRAISWVMAGGIVAAFLGPGIATWTWDLFSIAPYAGSYVSLLLLYTLSIMLIIFLKMPRPSPEEKSGPARPLPQIASQPEFLVAVFSALVAYGVMNLIMVATPIEMKGCGFDLASSASVIQWHIVAMFLPSFVTGHLIRFFGVTRVMICGPVLLVMCVLMNLHGTTIVHFTGALVLLGIGWNFLFIGGTTLLTEVYWPAEKAKVQGLNDFLVFSTVAMTAVSSGFLHDKLGWVAINYAVLPIIAMAFCGLVWLDWRRRITLSDEPV